MLRQVLFIKECGKMDNCKNEIYRKMVIKNVNIIVQNAQKVL